MSYEVSIIGLDCLEMSKNFSEYDIGKDISESDESKVKSRAHYMRQRRAKLAVESPDIITEQRQKNAVREQKRRMSLRSDLVRWFAIMYTSSTIESDITDHRVYINEIDSFVLW